MSIGCFGTVEGECHFERRAAMMLCKRLDFSTLPLQKNRNKSFSQLLIEVVRWIQIAFAPPLATQFELSPSLWNTRIPADPETP